MEVVAAVALEVLHHQERLVQAAVEVIPAQELLEQVERVVTEGLEVQVQAAQEAVLVTTEVVVEEKAEMV
jgi:hypothetical protein